MQHKRRGARDGTDGGKREPWGKIASAQEDKGKSHYFKTPQKKAVKYIGSTRQDRDPNRFSLG